MVPEDNVARVPRQCIQYREGRCKMKRTLVVLGVVLALLLLATPGLAGGGNGPGHGEPPVFALQGCISLIDGDAKTFEVSVVKSMKGSTLPDQATILTDEGTLFYEYYWDESQEEWVRKEIGFGDLTEYDPVSVRGQETASGLLAVQVTVNPDCPWLRDECVPPVP